MMGRVKANEMLIGDGKMTAQEAARYNAINGSIEMPDLEPFIDIDKVPFLRKIIDSDPEIVVNTKRLMMQARNIGAIKEAF